MSAQLVTRGFAIAWRGAPVAAPLPAVGKDQRHWRVYTRGRRVQAWQRTVLATSGSVSLVPGTAALTLSGPAASVVASGNISLIPGTAALALTGSAPTVLAGGNISLVPGTASLSLSGAAPTLAMGGNIALTPGTAQLSLAGFAPVVNAGVMTADPAFVATITRGSTKVFPHKDPGESITVTFDFSAETSSVSVPTVVVVVELPAQVDLNPSALVLGSPQVNPANPAQVFQRITGGLDGNDYGLRMTATAANGDTLLCPARLPVRNATP
jgi:prolyl-tRNA editing enzyme YbaK/EbsC (Cys-tRNA(Pro) deacylase)